VGWGLGRVGRDYAVRSALDSPESGWQKVKVVADCGEILAGGNIRPVLETKRTESYNLLCSVVVYPYGVGRAAHATRAMGCRVIFCSGARDRAESRKATRFLRLACSCGIWTSRRCCAWAG
jgi:hypothetical protein